MGKKAAADRLQQKSPAEFFADNKNIAGFDNPGKSLYTTFRELVENSLDSSESIGVLPEILIRVEEISQTSLNNMVGLSAHERMDEELYQDYETDKALQKRLSQEVKEQQKLEKLIAKKGEKDALVEAKRKELEQRKKSGAAKTKTYYRVTVEDNGSGMPHKDIPDMLGRVLSGTKYGVKQTRGKFGLGAKMALVWSKMTTGRHFEICSALQGQSFRSHYQLDIDIHRNEPIVHKVEMRDNQDRWHGTRLSVTIEGAWTPYRSYILRYLRHIAIITPYADFRFEFAAEDAKHNISLHFTRRTHVMPPPPQATKHHPSSVDLELVKRLLSGTKTSSLKAFLSKEFDCISKEHAARLAGELQGGSGADLELAQLTEADVIRLHQLLHQAKFKDPSGSHLSPAGEYNLRLGVMKELRPDLLATHQGEVRVFEGHAFVVGAAVSLGGRDVKPGLNIYRYANRIPLLFEAGADVITKTANKRINWTNYKINPNSDKVGVFVSIVSTKIPFKGAGKEYIGDDVLEMVAAVKQAIQSCCLQLKTKIVRRQAQHEQQQRKRSLLKYIPNAADSIFSILQAMVERGDGGPKRRRLLEQRNLLEEVRRGTLTRAVLATQLSQHVERVDSEQALEYQMQE